MGSNFIIDGNLFKNIQSCIKRETEKSLGKGNGISVGLSEIREFVVENQKEMFANGGKSWVIDHFVKQIQQQRKEIVPVESHSERIIISNNYTNELANTETSLPVPVAEKPALTKQAPTQALSTELSLPSEILAEVQSKFSNYSQEVQMEVVNHLQELKLQSALELRQKLDELSNLEARLLSKILGDFRTQHENNLSSLRKTLSETRGEVAVQAGNFTQSFQQRTREIEMMFGL